MQLWSGMFSLDGRLRREQGGGRREEEEEKGAFRAGQSASSLVPEGSVFSSSQPSSQPSSPCSHPAVMSLLPLSIMAATSLDAAPGPAFLCPWAQWKSMSSTKAPRSSLHHYEAISRAGQPFHKQHLINPRKEREQDKNMLYLKWSFKEDFRPALISKPLSKPAKNCSPSSRSHRSEG
ncbi:hypothetical protein EYF80_002767 [Liparis tanakae]|uniref:Uncharacterized protein n=1 Tax=Liparis tanakae TaxID=230148 RepID=A0A4Z2JCI2_9TELE|nr:hypothetical protein EYF80_002767 [Liparis tanakae]